ncbi:hypothetical protein F4813DRAFT_201138 [Daldinia decipiens]|uniref:uncharacterized protein n=1 Tax=Daldinia decipiens TaxID=326647 RepID=UPI0020C3C408|nr:uncharacterized protein F4813DRAFT_201138 [Daldinia decipiens]KAI1654704.1 hypothetical protein F4813DRAFT_201138 [Daldinia decipiens]
MNVVDNYIRRIGSFPLTVTLKQHVKVSPAHILPRLGDCLLFCRLQLSSLITLSRHSNNNSITNSQNLFLLFCRLHLTEHISSALLSLLGMVRSGSERSLVRILVIRASTLTRLEPNGPSSLAAISSLSHDCYFELARKSHSDSNPRASYLVPRGPARSFGSGVSPRLMYMVDTRLVARNSRNTEGCLCIFNHFSWTVIPRYLGLRAYAFTLGIE